METDTYEINFPYGNATADNCLVIRRNRTLFFSVYEGIPETLLLNVITWILLILLFSLIRQQAWDYGRLALVNGRDSKTWTQLFFAQEYSEMAKHARNQESTTSAGFIEKMGFVSWIKMTLKLTNDQILAHAGPDATHYLSFQRQMIIVMAIISCISLVVVLPVNLQGTLYANATTFGHTTISNLSPDSRWLWVHVFVAISFAPLIVLTMRRSSGRYASKTAPSRTIMASNIAKADCNRGIIKEYVTERFADVIIEDVQLAYNISKLTDACDEYHKVVLARHYCEDNRNRQAIKVTTDYWKCVQKDGLQYYREKEINLFAQVARLRSIALNEPLGIAFITLSSTDSAQLVLKHFKPGSYRQWALSFAPNACDIFWENLSDSTAGWYVRWVCVNLLLFVFLFFMTTPALVVNVVNTLPWYQEFTKISSLVSEFLPTLLLWTVSVLMPVVVGYSERFLKHWTKSELNYTIMTKAFGYLLFMILILPSLGLTSAKALLEWSINKREDEAFRFECIFLPDKGAFYVNYIITSAFIGTAAELLRFSELSYYFWQILTAKSVAEIPYVRRSILTEFPFGHHYSWMLIIFTVSVCYSIATPLIMPFAMVYMCLKHVGDRYNLFFAYGPSNMVSQGGGKIHSTAVTLTKSSVIILFLNMAALSYVRNGNGFDARGILLTATLLITLALFMFMSPIKRCTTKPPRIRPDLQPSQLYVADVLQDRRHFQDRPAHVDYGSDTASIVMTQGEEEVSSIASA